MQIVFLLFLTLFLNSHVYAVNPIKISCPPTDLIASSETCRSQKDPSGHEYTSCKYHVTYAGFNWIGGGKSLKNFQSNSVRIYSSGSEIANCGYMKGGTLGSISLKSSNLSCDAIDPGKNCSSNDSNCTFTCNPK